MAKVNYQLANGGTELHIEDDAQVIVLSDLQGQLTAFQTIASLDDQTRTWIATSGLASAGVPGGFPDLGSFDEFIEDEVDRLRDILDYPSYETAQVSKTVLDGAWQTPVAIESASHEEVGSEATQAIDGEFDQWWQSNTSGVRTLVVKLRDYKKRYSKLRLRILGGDDRTKLQDVTLKMSVALVMIDEPQSIIAQNVDFDHQGAAWTEFVFPNKKNGKYLKLEMATSLHSNPDELRIRELELFATITNHDK